MWHEFYSFFFICYREYNENRDVTEFYLSEFWCLHRAPILSVLPHTEPHLFCTSFLLSDNFFLLLDTDHKGTDNVPPIYCSLGYPVWCISTPSQGPHFTTPFTVHLANPTASRTLPIQPTFRLHNLGHTYRPNIPGHVTGASNSLFNCPPAHTH